MQFLLECLTIVAGGDVGECDPGEGVGAAAVWWVGVFGDA